MGKKFKIGKSYECANFHLQNIKVLNRTKKNISVDDGIEVWNARIMMDKDGDEYIQKRETNIANKGIQTYSASWEIN